MTRTARLAVLLAFLPLIGHAQTYSGIPVPGDANLIAAPAAVAVPGWHDDVRAAIGACLNVAALPARAFPSSVTVALSLTQRGVPIIDTIRMIGQSGGTQQTAAQLYESARRAILRCGSGGLPLPLDRYDQWREMELVFDTGGMQLR